MSTGHARVSTVDQNPASRRDVLTEARREKIFTGQVPGMAVTPPHLADAISFARSGDTIVVWKPDRLARSIRQWIDTAETPRA